MTRCSPTRRRPVHYLLDMQMMAMFGRARERTVEEFERLFLAAGLTTRRVISTASPMSLIEAALLPDAA